MYWIIYSAYSEPSIEEAISASKEIFDPYLNVRDEETSLLQDLMELFEFHPPILIPSPPILPIVTEEVYLI